MNGFSLIKNYFIQYKHYVFAGFLALVVVDGMQIIVPWLIKNAIDALSTGVVSDRYLLKIGVYILFIAIVIGATRFVWRYFIIGLSRKIEEDLRNRFYKHLHSQTFTYFDHVPVGDLMAHATNDLEAVRMMCGMAIVASMDAGLLMVASLVMMMSINVTLTGWVLIPMPIVTVTILMLGPRMHRRFAAVQEGFSRLSEKAQETFAGIRVVKSFVQEDAEKDNFRQINEEYLNRNMQLVRVWGLMRPIIWAVAGSCSAIILFVGGSRVIDHQMSMGDFVAFNSYLGILVWPMIAVGWVVNLYQRGKASLNRLDKVFRSEPSIVSPPNAIDKPVSGNIEFRHLTFSYEPGQPVLHDINLTIPRGSWISIMGGTGSSKSTLVHLIGRFYDPPEGTVFIDDIDVRSYNLQTLRSQIAFVPQQTFLFSDTIDNNIQFGLDLPMSRIEYLAERAQVLQDIQGFSRKMGTVVGEKGVTLSGGQKQRVAIARALAIEAPIIVLDDSLSAVDTETESALLDHMRFSFRDRTVLMVSHRVSSSRMADCIVFLEDGVIVEQGTHDELLKLKGRYYEIYEHQRLMEEIDIAAETPGIITEKD